MSFIDEIDKETLIISNGNIKEVIMNMQILKPIKYLSIKEFIHKYYFDYDEKTIMYIVNKYNVRYDIASKYLENIYYVENEQYNNTKLDFLVDLKNDLINNNLLIYDDMFKRYLKRIKIILYDIEINEFLMEIFSNYDYQVIDREYKYYEHVVYEFDNMEEEITYVANSICELIDKKIEPCNIKLTNVAGNYYNTLERIFSLFNLRINIPYKTSLASYSLVQQFIKMYKENDNNLVSILDKLDKENVIYQELVKVINRYIKYDDKNLLLYKLENSYINSKKYDNGIDIIDYMNYIAKDDEYIFMVGFNEGLIPKSEKDNEYITDNICSVVGLNSTRERNKLINKKTIDSINDIKNLVITYMLKDDKKGYYASSLTNLFKVEKAINSDDYSYSEVYDKIKLVKSYDDYFKFGYVHKEFPILINNYKIKYNSFDNKYHKIDRVMDKLTLSYSKMQMYNKCAFRYYLSDILKLDIFEENFSTVIGSMVHYAMQMVLSNNDMDIDKYVSEYLKGRILTRKEQFFLDKYKVAIKELLDQVLLEREYSLFNKAMYEKKIDIDYGNNVHFVGIIDKILYYIDNDTTYISLIDYKTGNDDISLKYLKYGLNIQLPIYLYLSTKLEFNKIKYPGFYLQKFNISNKDYRLVGYSNSDKEILSVIDKDYDHSKIIKGLKTNKDGSFSRNSKVLNDNDIDEITIEVEKQISGVIDKIKNNQFEINPKVSDGINLGCAYCKFKDICFKQPSDEVKIVATENGGDD